MLCSPQDETPGEKTAMAPTILTFDVTDALPAEVTQGERVTIVARLFVPPEPPRGRMTVLTCLHGGSYDWRYYHVEVPGHPGYSMAEHMAALGHVVITVDQLGVGESSRPANARKAVRQVVAAATHAAMQQAYQRLRDGTLDPRLPPCADLLKVGIGHSMGGMTVITEQAEFATYDLTAVLGHSNFGAYIEADGKLVKNSAPFDPASPDYKTLDRDRVMRSFHWDTTPAAVLAADAAIAVQYPAILGWEAQQGGTEQDAGRITTPIFLVMGERDVSHDPHAELELYSGSPDLTFMVLGEAAHCHNFAPSRRRLWNRLDRWIGSLADSLD
jgi:alpha-beta hydrolase superfamily lysophospholipase